MVWSSVAEAESWPHSYLLDTCPGDLGVEQLIAMAEDTSEELDTVARHMQSLYKASAGKSTLRMRIQVIYTPRALLWAYTWAYTWDVRCNTSK